MLHNFFYLYFSPVTRKRQETFFFLTFFHFLIFVFFSVSLVLRCFGDKNVNVNTGILCQCAMTLSLPGAFEFFSVNLLAIINISFQFFIRLFLWQTINWRRQNHRMFNTAFLFRHGGTWKMTTLNREEKVFMIFFFSSLESRLTSALAFDTFIRSKQSRQITRFDTDNRLSTTQQNWFRV